MKIKVLFFSLLFLATGGSLFAAPTITVSGNSVSILGSAQTISLTCTLIDPNNSGNLRSGSNIITVFVTSTVTPGNVATCGPVYGNDVITDGYGNANTTYYKVQVFTVSGGIVASTPSLQQFYAFTGSGTVDLATATPLAPSFFTGPSGSVSIPGALAVAGATTLNSSLTVSGTGTFKQLNNSYNATQFSGSDIYAQVNAAMATACPGTSSSTPGGVIVIPPGVYNTVTTTLDSRAGASFQNQGCKIEATGTLINFTGTGPAILIKNTTNFQYNGGQINGPGAAGSVRGIQMGDRTGLTGSSQSNLVSNVVVNSFGICFFGDGATGGTTEFNTILNVHCGQFGGNGNGKGFVLTPGTQAFFNNNYLIGVRANFSTTDGMVLDGAADLTIIGDSESNGGCGIRLGDTLSTPFHWINVHTENNTTADYCSATPSNLSFNRVFGPSVSATACSNAGGCRGMWTAGTRNDFRPANISWIESTTPGSAFQMTVDAASPVANIWQLFNNESPPSGITNLLGCSRSGADSGLCGIGSPEYPASAVGNIVPRSAATGSDTIGTAPLPYSGVFIGSNVNNSVKLAATATGNRTATFPDATMNVVGDTTAQTLTNKTLNVPLTSGTGLQIFNTTTTCTTGASVGATCTTAVISLPVGEADTSYRVSCTGKGLTNVPVVIATTNSSATQFTITIAALTAAAASFASYDCVAGHN